MRDRLRKVALWSTVGVIVGLAWSGLAWSADDGDGDTTRMTSSVSTVSTTGSASFGVSPGAPSFGASGTSGQSGSAQKPSFLNDGGNGLFSSTPTKALAANSREISPAAAGSLSGVITSLHQGRRYIQVQLDDLVGEAAYKPYRMASYLPVHELNGRLSKADALHKGMRIRFQVGELKEEGKPVMVKVWALSSYVQPQD